MALDSLSYYYAGKPHHFARSPRARAAARRRPAVRGLVSATRDLFTTDVRTFRATVGKYGPRAALFHDPAAAEPVFIETPEMTVVIPTETFIVEGANRALTTWLRKDHGAEVVAEGRQGKLLFRVPGDRKNRVATAFDLARRTFRRGTVEAAHPNFIRAITKLSPSTSRTKVQWNLDNTGTPGVPNADVHARAAWTITKGLGQVAVAVLDEGVDTLHSDLKPAVRAERDFVDGRDHARPDGDDAHGTACAGIIASRSSRWPGLGPQLSLIAVRIAKDDGNGNWIFDDFQTADAIDWAWENGADVLSNSWGGGPPVDVITNAFERARTKGRKGKGSVVVIAAGNEEGPVSFPGTLPDVLTVGASNQWDQRKTRKSRDGEDWWGSNYGSALDLLAPGVRIATTDIRGKKGYGKGRYTLTFNGTSAATPHVAAAVALVLSVAPHLGEQRVRDIIKGTADRLPGQTRWNPHEGNGRLNVYAALRTARGG